MTIEEMKERKEQLEISYEQIAGLSGIQVETVQDMLEGNIQ